MTDEEYEQAYREALLSIPNADIGEYYLQDGEHLCRINGIPRTDFEVFELGWGRKIAEQIQRERFGRVSVSAERTGPG